MIWTRVPRTPLDPPMAPLPSFLHFNIDRIRRRTVHGDHYVTGNIPGAGSDWSFM